MFVLIFLSLCYVIHSEGRQRMLDQFSRTQLLLGQEGMARLFCARVAVFGIGGVGGHAVEALARSGVGTLDLIDDDRVCLTNLNRQIFATRKTVGQYKMDPTAFEVTDICKTSVCPLARVMRHELKKRGIKSLKVVYSKEPALTPIEDMSISCRAHCICPPGTARKCTQRRQVPGSNAFVPAVAGLILAGEVVKDLAGYQAAP